MTLLVVVLLAVPALGQTQGIAEAIDKYLLVRTELGRFSGAVLVAKDGKIIFRKGYGYADVERKIPYTPETQHEVASITKMFTSMAALKLRDQGKLKLTDSICNYLDDCPDAWKPVTVQHLMRHTSGIPDYEEKLELGSEKHVEFMRKPDSTAIIFADAKKLPLDFKPGEKFHYSNSGYVVLSYLIEKVARKPFNEFVTKTLLKPAGMKESGLFGRNTFPKKLAPGYTHGDLSWEIVLAGAPLTAGHLKKLPQIALTPPAGDAALYSTVDDLYRWSVVMDGGRLVSAEEVAEVFTPGLDGYGYGWFIDRGFERKRVWHTGGLPGYASDFVKFPDDKVTIVLFSNVERTRLSRIRRDISAIVFGKPYDMPVRGNVVKLSADQFAKFVGDYKMSDGAILTIGSEPDNLSARIKDRFFAGLIPMSETEFYFPLAEGKAIFTLDETGRAVKVNLRYSGEDHLGERVVP
jgi:CubicO group peptidase (beta-lactamase class C family)